jgi:hypothetical protein
MRRKRRNKACDAERRNRRYDPERRRKRYLAEREKKRVEAQRHRAAYDRYMQANLALPDNAWKTETGKQCHAIRIWRRQYWHNHQHMRVLTTGKGVRFQIIN